MADEVGSEQLRKRLKHGTEAGQYSHLEEVRVLRVSCGRLYHDHLETRWEGLRQERISTWAVQMRPRGRTESSGFPRISMCKQSEAEVRRGEAGSPRINASDEFGWVRMGGRWWEVDACHDAHNSVHRGDSEGSSKTVQLHGPCQRRRLWLPSPEVHHLRVLRM
jgi:hypothetical protein